MICFNCKSKISFGATKVKCGSCHEVFCLNCTTLDAFSIEKNSKRGWCNNCFIRMSEHQLNDQTNLLELLSPSRDLNQIIATYVKPTDPQNDYEVWVLIHSSSISQVYSATSKQHRKPYAIKSIREDNNLDKVLNEFLFPSRVVAKNIVRSFEIFRFNQNFYIVSELMVMNLFEFIRNSDLLKEKIVLHLFREIANGLNEIHEKSVSHRDLKPSNIFINSKGIVKIGDFGEMGSMKYRNLLESMVGSPMYIAPEILKGEPYTYLCDIWSLGITTLEITKSELYKSPNVYTLMEEIKNNEPPKINSRYSRHLSEIVSCCLQKNPSSRLSARQLLSLPPVKQAKDCTSLILKEAMKIVARRNTYLPNLANDNVLLFKLLYEKEVTLEFLMKFNKIAEILQKFENPEEKLTQVLMEMEEFQVLESKVRYLKQVSLESIENHRKSAVFRSLYFENIPDDLNLEKVLNAFEEFGNVSYASLPKWPETGLLKGFGFVEFEDIGSCEKAFQEFRTFSSCELENVGGSVKVMRKTDWLQCKRRLTELKRILEADMPDREFTVMAFNVPERITKTQISDLLQIKPWKIEYKQSSGRAKLIYSNELDVKALIRIQPSLLGQPVYYSYNSKRS